jgi:dTDP-4-amino-4,6-dideoxygalactose transaminase
LERARRLSLHGMSGHAWARYSDVGSWYYEIVEPGYKYNMTDVQAALGLRQLERLDSMQVRRQEVVKLYWDSMGDLEAIELPVPRPHVESAWHLFPVRLRLEAMDTDRAGFINRLKALNIGTSVHFIPIHLHPYYRDKYGYREGDFPIAESAYHRLVSLPLHPGLSDADAMDVVDAVRDACSR